MSWRDKKNNESFGIELPIYRQRNLARNYYQLNFKVLLSFGLAFIFSILLIQMGLSYLPKPSDLICGVKINDSSF